MFADWRSRVFNRHYHHHPGVTHIHIWWTRGSGWAEVKESAGKKFSFSFPYRQNSQNNKKKKDEQRRGKKRLMRQGTKQGKISNNFTLLFPFTRVAQLPSLLFESQADNSLMHTQIRNLICQPIDLMTAKTERCTGITIELGTRGKMQVHDCNFIFSCFTAAIDVAIHETIMSMEASLHAETSGNSSLEVIECDKLNVTR